MTVEYLPILGGVVAIVITIFTLLRSFPATREYKGARYLQYIFIGWLGILIFAGIGLPLTTTILPIFGFPEFIPSTPDYFIMPFGLIFLFLLTYGSIKYYKIVKRI